MKWLGMRRVFAEIAAAGLTLTLCALFLEKAFEGYKTPVDYVLGPLKAGDPVTLLIVGNSHTGALGAERLRADDVTHNASVGGQDIYRSYLLLRAFVPKLPRLREVIVALDYDAVGYNISVFNQDWQDRQYYRYTGQLYRDGTLPRLLARSAFFRANRDIGALFSKPQPEGGRPNPILPVVGGLDSTPEGCRLRAKEHSEVKFDERLIDENIGYLRAIVALGSRRQISIHFLNPPKRDCYRAGYSAATRRDGLKAIGTALGRDGASFHDFFEADFSDDDFRDHDHLTPAGSRKLMGQLALRTRPVGE